MDSHRENEGAKQQKMTQTQWVDWLLAAALHSQASQIVPSAQRQAQGLRRVLAQESKP